MKPFLNPLAALFGLILFAQTATSAELRAFFGNLHSHTKFSDGSGTPSEAYQFAKANGLHFLAITEHNQRSAEIAAAFDCYFAFVHEIDHQTVTGCLQK